MYGSAAIYWGCVCQRQTVQFDGGLVGTSHIELAVGRGATECVGNLLGQVAALCDGNVRSVLLYGQILRHVARYSDGSRRSAVCHAYGAVGHVRVVHCHAANVTQCENFVQDGERVAVGIGHLARLRCGELVGDVAHLHVQCLGPCRYCQHDGYYI